MNDRIRELIKQAMVLDDDELFVREVFDKEKFAELIVRECANVAGYYYSRNECVRPHQIRQHFGLDK